MPDAGQVVDLTSEPEGDGGLIAPEVVEGDEGQHDLGNTLDQVDLGNTLDQVDLTTEAPLREGLSTPDSIAHDREKLRGRLAMSSLVLLTGLLVATYVGLISSRVSGADTKDFLSITLPAVTAITSGAVAFYFGTERSGSR